MSVALTAPVSFWRFRLLAVWPAFRYAARRLGWRGPLSVLESEAARLDGSAADREILTRGACTAPVSLDTPVEERSDLTVDVGRCRRPT